MISAIIVAAGQSVRFGDDKLKKNLNNKTVLETTIDKFLSIPSFRNIIIVTNEEKIEDLRNKYDEPKLKFTTGGETRTASVTKGLGLLSTKNVLIHDGARPFVSVELIEKIIKELKTNEAVIPTLPVTSCLKQINPSLKTVKREDYVLTQTPQGFNGKLIVEAYEKVGTNVFYDDSEVLERYFPNSKIKLIDGEESNIKITFPSDLK